MVNRTEDADIPGGGVCGIVKKAGISLAPVSKIAANDMEI